jgi:GDPmannose 4,6-dehydratase
MSSTKVALISGITGQDGSHLAEFLLAKGYHVDGIVRRASTFNAKRIRHLFDDPYSSGGRLTVHYGDMTDAAGLASIVNKVKPDEVYNLAAQSHVRVSFDSPEYTVDSGALGTLRLLEAVRSFQEHSGKQVRFYQASSSEMFGATPPPQNEATPFHPRSPYACGKVFSHWQTVNYRESYNMFACNGILFNHEGPRRGEHFVTRKITRAAARIKMGLQNKVALGNLDARRDWGYAGDYVKAMWMMLQADAPDDYVVATGQSYSVRDFLERAFGALELDYKEYVVIDPEFFRPAEVDHLLGDASKIREKLGWVPETSFETLVKMMVEEDLEIARRERVLREAGFRVGSRGTGGSYLPFA